MQTLGFPIWKINNSPVLYSFNLSILYLTIIHPQLSILQSLNSPFLILMSPHYSTLLSPIFLLNLYFILLFSNSPQSSITQSYLLSHPILHASILPSLKTPKLQFSDSPIFQPSVPPSDILQSFNSLIFQYTPILQ